MEYHKDSIVRIIDDEEVAAFRTRFWRYLANDAWSVMQAHDRIQSVTYYIAQYWEDNAHDQIHINGFPSVRDQAVRYAQLTEYSRWDPLNVAIAVDPKSCAPRANRRYWVTPVSFLASYCREVIVISDLFLDAHTPLLVVRRLPGEAVEYELLREPVRPWLDGVATEWAIKADSPRDESVGDLYELMDELDAECDPDLQVFERQSSAQVGHSGPAQHPGVKAVKELIESGSWDDLLTVVDLVVEAADDELWRQLLAGSRFLPSVPATPFSESVPGHINAGFPLASDNGPWTYYQPAVVLLAARCPDRTLADQVRSLCFDIVPLDEDHSWGREAYYPDCGGLIDQVSADDFPNLDELWLTVTSSSTVDVSRFEGVRQVCLNAERSSSFRPEGLVGSNLAKPGAIRLPASTTTVYIDERIPTEIADNLRKSKGLTVVPIERLTNR